MGIELKISFFLLWLLNWTCESLNSWTRQNCLMARHLPYIIISIVPMSSVDVKKDIFKRKEKDWWWIAKPIFVVLYLAGIWKTIVYVVVKFYPWFKFCSLLFLGIVMYDNEFETNENNFWTKDKIEPQHIHLNSVALFWHVHGVLSIVPTKPWN